MREGDLRFIPEGEDPSARKLAWKEVAQPESAGLMGPRFDSVPVNAMDGDDINFKRLLLIMLLTQETTL